MPFEETREQQQMYNLFRSCIYICLIIELIMNVPVGSENPMARQFMEIISAIGVFNSVASSKITEFICILITCIGTTAKKIIEFFNEADGNLSYYYWRRPNIPLFCFP